MRRNLNKSEILRGKRTFQSLFERGRRIRSDHFQGLVLVDSPHDPEMPPVRVATVVPKSAGKAVSRNRVRRLMREAYRLNKEILHSPDSRTGGTLRIVFLWSPRTPAALRSVTFDLVNREMSGILTRIHRDFQCQSSS